ncbi:F-box-like domain superfamily [Arabidopsis thaliana x Arabidopsis arenosa]|uniref:F-box-like domain superfamily n=1 Tax=Arabidopsis thaliana x Arabidopsis arenosa TaxID=1240361 RepID=A0A8T2BIC5_9BRAS|nr:F-box-like domain superfamily [Arabidopsis thaliana x Arabidopsis arenosa]
MMPNWSQLPEELLNLISKNLDNCFDVIHARSVCRSWRSAFPFPSCLLSLRYYLPTFAKFPSLSKDLCTLKKIQVFLFRVRNPAAVAASISEYFLGGIDQDNSNDHMELPSPLQCSVKVKIPQSDPILVNMLDYQILPLGYRYIMIGWDPESLATGYAGLAFLPLNKNGGEEFIVLLGYCNHLLVLKSAEMRWTRVKKTSIASCKGLVTFRGRFYVTFLNGDIYIFDPYSLEQTLLMPSQPLRSSKYLIPTGNDELFLVEKFNPFPEADILDFNRFTCRVSKLDEEAGIWVEVTDLGDRVLFIGHFGNICCSAKELPNGCGVSGNSILFTNEPGNVTFAYKYGVHTGRAEDELNIWRFSREIRVMIVNTFPVVTLRLERQAENLCLDNLCLNT